jgi:alpha-glucuronidase
MKKCKLFLLILTFVGITISAIAENGYDLWLRYHRIDNTDLRMQYTNKFARIMLLGKSETIQAVNKELNTALPMMFGSPVVVYSEYKRVVGANIAGKDNSQNLKATCLLCINRVIIATKDDLSGLEELELSIDYSKSGDEGYIIKWVKHQDSDILLITANTHIGLLYGVFHFLEDLQQQKELPDFAFQSAPLIKNRVLDHWDNLDRTIERGYAGFSIWDWQKLPDYIDQRYIDYARACASLGINGSVLTNVNANSWVLTPTFLQKVAA